MKKLKKLIGSIGITDIEIFFLFFFFLIFSVKANISIAFGQKTIRGDMMKFNFKMEKGQSYLVIEYVGDEYKEFETKFKDIGLHKTTTKLGFGENMNFSYWREPQSEMLLNFISSEIRNDGTRCEYRLFDDINKKVLDEYDEKLNVAVFRVVPTKNIVKVPLAKYLSVNDVQKIMNTFTTVFSYILQIVTNLEFSVALQKAKVVMKTKDADGKTKIIEAVKKEYPKAENIEILDDEYDPDDDENEDDDDYDYEDD